MTNVNEKNLVARTASSRRMLELEKRYKLDRIRGTLCPPISIHSRPLQVRRAESMQLAQAGTEDLEVKTARRIPRPIPLSISIPQPVVDQSGIATAESEEREGNGVTSLEQNNEKEKVIKPLQKQVKFLARKGTEEEEEKEDMVSEASSICQSPSWEGYGQKKKEKKEAEKMKKRKERANKEAKTTERKQTSRLSKLPPSTRRTSVNPQSFGNMERSMSDTVLTQQKSQKLEPSLRICDIGQIPGEVLPGISVDSSMRAMMSDPETQPNGAASLAKRRGDSPSNILQSTPRLAEENLQEIVKKASVGTRLRVPKSQSVSIGLGATAPSRDGRSPRETCPPSASRSHFLRQLPVPRENKSQGDTSVESSVSSQSQESFMAPSSSETGRQRTGYVRNQRDQSTKRVLMGLDDEQVLPFASSPTSSSRSSSQHGRRSSFTAEARNMAMWLAGFRSNMKREKKAHARSCSSVDYLGPAQHTCPSQELGGVMPNEKLPDHLGSTENSLDPDLREKHHTTTAIRLTDEMLLSQKTAPVLDDGAIVSDPTRNLFTGDSASGKKSRRLKDVARAAFHIGGSGASTPLLPSQPPTPSDLPVYGPPTYKFRGFLNGHLMDPAVKASTKIISTPQAENTGPALLSKVTKRSQRRLPAINVEQGECSPYWAQAPAPSKKILRGRQLQSEVSGDSSTSTTCFEEPRLPSSATATATSLATTLRATSGLSPEGRPAPETLLPTKDHDRRPLQSTERIQGMERSSTPLPSRIPSSEIPQSSDEGETDQSAMDVDVDAQSFVTSLTHFDKSEKRQEGLEEAFLPVHWTSSLNDTALWISDENIQARRKPRVSSDGMKSMLASNASFDMELRGRSYDPIEDAAPPPHGMDDETKVPARPGRCDDGTPETKKQGHSLRRPPRFFQETNYGQEKSREASQTDSSSPGLEEAASTRSTTRASREGTESSAEPQQKEQMVDQGVDKRTEMPKRRKKVQLNELNRSKWEKHPAVSKTIALKEEHSTPDLQPALSKRDLVSTPSNESGGADASLSRFVAASRGGDLDWTRGYTSGPYHFTGGAEKEEMTAEPAAGEFGKAEAIVDLTAPDVTFAESRTMPLDPPKAASEAVAARPPASRNASSASANAPSTSDAKRRPASLGASPAATPSASPPLLPVTKLSVIPSSTRTTATVIPVSIIRNGTLSPTPPSSAASTLSSQQRSLSALPKHMQVPRSAVLMRQSPTTTTTAAAAAAAEAATTTTALSSDPTGAPIAKIFVECCNCNFFHDMPSKLYECMAKPDAVVEDRTLGISGAITTMVKCPWCQHNMSTRCCAGYAAVVYLKERLH